VAKSLRKNAIISLVPVDGNAREKKSRKGVNRKIKSSTGENRQKASLQEKGGDNVKVVGVHVCRGRKKVKGASKTAISRASRVLSGMNTGWSKRKMAKSLST